MSHENLAEAQSEAEKSLVSASTSTAANNTNGNSNSNHSNNFTHVQVTKDNSFFSCNDGCNCLKCQCRRITRKENCCCNGSCYECTTSCYSCKLCMLRQDTKAQDMQVEVQQNDISCRTREIQADGYGCNQNGEILFDVQTIPVGVRLNARRKTYIDEIKAAIPHPAGTLPLTYYPGWKKIPLEKKIPQAPAPPGTLVLARGTLGKKLHRISRKYNVLEPRHRATVVSDCYESLHDPYAQGYYRKPSVKKLLIDQGLITPEGRVICSLKQFNNYREYLRNIYNETLEDHIKSMEQDKLSTKEHALQDQGRDSHHELKMQEIVQKLNQKKINDYKKFKEKQKRENQRLIEHQKNQFFRRFFCTIMKGKEDCRRRIQSIELLHRKQIRKDALLKSVVSKDQMVAKRLGRNRHKMAQAYKLFVRDFLCL